MVWRHPNKEENYCASHTTSLTPHRRLCYYTCMSNSTQQQAPVTTPARKSRAAKINEQQAAIAAAAQVTPAKRKKKETAPPAAPVHDCAKTKNGIHARGLCKGCYRKRRLSDPTFTTKRVVVPPVPIVEAPKARRARKAAQEPPVEFETAPVKTRKTRAA